jgi:hypothetical protein
MVLASYPTFWDVVWWMVIFFVWVAWIYVVIRVFIDNFERRDHTRVGQGVVDDPDRVLSDYRRVRVSDCTAT